MPSPQAAEIETELVLLPGAAVTMLAPAPFPLGLESWPARDLVGCV